MDIALEQMAGVVVITAPEAPLHKYFPEEQYADLLCEVVNANLSKEIILDLSQIEFGRTPLLSALVRAHVAASRRHRKLAICSPTRFLRDVLRKMRLDHLLQIFPSREEALAAINAPGDFYSDN